MARTVLVEMEKLGNLNSGLGQFCLHLGNAFSTIKPEELNLKFYLPARHDQIFGSSFDYIYQKPLHKFLRFNSSGMDVWHCTHQLSKYLPSSKKTKLILTVHDLNFLRKYTGIKRGLYLGTLQRKINRAAAIAVISKFTEEELREHLRIPDIPVKLVYIGTSLKKFDQPLKPGFTPAGKFLFSIGIISPKKNFHVLLPMLARNKEYSLVIAGENKSAYADEIRALSSKLDLGDRVILPGPITDEEKYWAYTHCEALLFPSLSEGFGSPVIEAMSCGKPVFLSKYTSLPEIGGDVAFYFDTFDADGMASVLEIGLKEFQLNPDLVQKSIEHASQFSWDKAAQQYLELYNSV